MRLFIVIFVSLFLFSCNYKEQKHLGFTYSDKDYYYKLLSFNEEFREINAGDFVTANIEFFMDKNDSVFAAEEFIMQVIPQDSVCLGDLFVELREGDSVSFITPNNECVRDVLLPEFSELLRDDEQLTFNAKINKVQTEEEYLKQQYEYNLWLNSQHDFEYNNIESYIKSQRKEFEKTESGLYKFVLKEGFGKTPTVGEIINIGYQGSLLSGEIINHFTNMEFVYGSEWQVVKGIEVALSEMKVGERAFIIVPSEFAWGAEGSSNQEIEPFTTVIFDLELRSAEKREIKK